jgi:HxlR-like helix-turn-helix
MSEMPAHRMLELSLHLARGKFMAVMEKLAVIANSPADYERLGLSPTSIAPWEDGARTDDSAGTYEWWYFDAHLADGAKLVVTFMNKDIAEPQKPLSPLLRLNLDLPDGRHFEKLVRYAAGAWSAAKDHADVLILREACLGARRFEEFQRELGTGRNILTARLNSLVDEGLLKKGALPGAPSAARVPPYGEGPRRGSDPCRHGGVRRQMAAWERPSSPRSPPHRLQPRDARGRHVRRVR